MNIVDLLVTIVVVTILVTIVLAIVTYVAYKLRLSREPSAASSATGPQYFVRFDPPGETQAVPERVSAGSGATHAGDSTGQGTTDEAALSAAEGHAREA